jgi:hypothetical protein
MVGAERPPSSSELERAPNEGIALLEEIFSWRSSPLSQTMTGLTGRLDALTRWLNGRSG